MQGAGCIRQGVGCRVSRDNSTHPMPPARFFWFPVFGSRVSVLGFRFSVFGFRVWGFGFRVSGVGLRVSGFGFRRRVDLVLVGIAVGGFRLEAAVCVGPHLRASTSQSQIDVDDAKCSSRRPPSGSGFVPNSGCGVQGSVVEA